MSINFYAVLSRYYHEIFPLKPGKERFILDQVGKSPCRVLDIGCATGELAVVLATHGHRVTGLDMNPVMIRDARALSGSENVDVTWVESDMAALAGQTEPGSFDVVICLGNTLAHLPDIAEVRTFLRECRTVLTPGGSLIVQLVNFNRFLSHRENAFPVIETPGVRFTRAYSYENLPDQILFSMTLTEKSTGKTVSRTTPLIPITRDMLTEAMADAGFGSVECLGDFTGKPWQPDSAALVGVGGIE